MSDFSILRISCESYSRLPAAVWYSQVRQPIPGPGLPAPLALSTFLKALVRCHVRRRPGEIRRAAPLTAMSLFAHCDPDLSVDCVVKVIAQTPVFVTIGLAAISAVLYDVTVFWLGIGLLANMVVNAAVNIFMHPHDSGRIIKGTAGFLGNPSYKAQFCVYLAVTLLMFYDLFDVHVAGWVLAFLYFLVIAVLWAGVFLAGDAFGPTYFGAALGFVCAILFMWIYIYFLEPYSVALCYSWFGNLNGLRHSVSNRPALRDPRTHATMARLMAAYGTDDPKDIVNFACMYNGVVDKQSTDPVFTALGGPDDRGEDDDPEGEEEENAGL